MVMAGKYRLSKDIDMESMFVETVWEMKSFTALKIKRKWLRILQNNAKFYFKE